MKMNEIRPVILIHYGEIALKKGNKKYFVKKLKDNIKEHLKKLNPEVKEQESRIIVFYDKSEKDSEGLKNILKKIPGISYFAQAFITTDIDIEKLSQNIYKILNEKAVKFETFGVSTKRSYKNFPYNSSEINKIIGKYIQEKTFKKVNLGKPDLSINIEVIKEGIIFYFNPEKGIGGLPSGISGKLISLISGGIDSPVAAWRMIKRGSKIVFLHFHSYPYHQKISQEKVKEIVKKLTEYQISSKLYLFPFGDIQAKIKIMVNPQYRIVLYRRMMLRIAEKIASIEKAHGIVTGESLGQVSSQTLHNLKTINAVAKIPVLRPLIGMDKNEIIEESKKIGTFDISIIPDQDCCQLFTPKHPALFTKTYEIENIEDKIIKELESLVEKSFREMEIVKYSI